jgi:N-acyl-D-amino-acid deacylase
LDLDLVIRDGRIIDGTANPFYIADVGVKDGKIYAIGKLGEYSISNTIDASGCIVSPGFIDAHSHGDSNILIYRDMENLVHQGITTIVAGQCGNSPAPLSDLIREDAQNRTNAGLPEGYELELNWSTFEEYLGKVEKENLGVNVAHLVGHGTIRAAAMGYEARPPSIGEMEEMKKLTAEAMKSGAYGLSTGLIYPPGIYAETEEIIELAKVVSEFGGIYASHIRGEGKSLMKALNEALRVGKEAALPVQISHHKIASKSMWGLSVQTLELFEKARKEGLDVTFDQYPYIAGSTGLITCLPPWAHDGGKEKALERLRNPELRRQMRKDIVEGIEGWENFAGELGWENVYVSSVRSEENKPLEGLNMRQIKDHRGTQDEFTALYELLLEEDGAAGMVIFYGDEEDVKRIMAHPLQMVGTDAGCCNIEGPFSRGKPHPRHYGTYPRVLGRYVREERVLSWAEAIRKMSSFPAQRYGIRDRGILLPGYWADITIFNPKTIIDKATFKDPHKYPDGIPYVIVNGTVTIEEGNYTGIRQGKTLRKTIL